MVYGARSGQWLSPGMGGVRQKTVAQGSLPGLLQRLGWCDYGGSKLYPEIRLAQSVANANGDGDCDPDCNSNGYGYSHA